MVMTSAYDLPSVQKLGEGKGVRRQPVEGGVCYSLGESLYSSTSLVSAINHTWPPGILEREKTKQKKTESFFPLVYIN